MDKIKITQLYPRKYYEEPEKLKYTICAVHKENTSKIMDILSKKFPLGAQHLKRISSLNTETNKLYLILMSSEQVFFRIIQMQKVVKKIRII